MKPARLLITGGGSREFIDDVRYIGNISTGSLAAVLATEAVRRYHWVWLVHATYAILPPKWVQDSGLLTQMSFGSSNELLRHSVMLLKKRRFDAIIHSAAVADYIPQRFAGKIYCGKKDLCIPLRPSPKVVDVMRELAPDCIFVGFKLDSRVSRKELFEKARTLMARVDLDFVVANLLHEATNLSHSGWILSKDNLKAVRFYSKKDLAEKLLDRIEQRLCNES